MFDYLIMIKEIDHQLRRRAGNDMSNNNCKAGYGLQTEKRASLILEA